MSWKALNWATSQPLKSSRKAVLKSLANFANDEWHAWPSRMLLAEDAGVSERTLRRALSDLIEGGFIALADENHPSKGFILTPDSENKTGQFDRKTGQNDQKKPANLTARPANLSTKPANLTAPIDNHQNHQEPERGARGREPMASTPPVETDDGLPPSHRLKAEISQRYMPLAAKCERIAGDPPGVKYPGSGKIGFVRQWLCDAVNAGLSLDEAERVIIGAVTRVSSRMDEGKSLNYFCSPVAEDIAKFVSGRRMDELRAAVPSGGMTEDEMTAYRAYAARCRVDKTERMSPADWMEARNVAA